MDGPGARSATGSLVWAATLLVGFLSLTWYAVFRCFVC